MELKAQLESPTRRFMFSHIENDSEKVNFFTGLLDKETFFVLHDLLAWFSLNYRSEWKVGTLDLTEQLLLTLMKLCLNIKKLHLATEFNASNATVTNVFFTIVSALYDALFIGIMCKRTFENEECQLLADMF
jgi:Helix-turn-helix of DDE superfamily endonuclease